MRTLYLVRHAKSSWKNPGLDDFERPLNKRGYRDAPFMGKILKKMNVSPSLIISSSATRAGVTARTIAEKINYPLEKIQYSEDIYLAGEGELLRLIERLDDNKKKVMLVGHNPGFTSLANYFTSQYVNNVPTCGIFCVNFNIASWALIEADCGEFKFFEYPKKYASK
ncbi:histidine phosphatase family protein [Desulfococcaceae bacterium HSG9]|nr:histidine phosphatase family protein [Desulfococcaceae bacterium HSG9]